MDKKPNLESSYCTVSLFAIAALAVHLSWTSASNNDSFVRWLVWAVPTMLSRLFLFCLLIFAGIDGSETLFFIRGKTSTGSEHAGFRTSSNPDREDRHFFNFKVITYAACLGVSKDLIHGWYQLCQFIWDEMAKSAYGGMLALMIFLTCVLSGILFAVWLPVMKLHDKQCCGGERYTGNPEDRDGDPLLG